MEINKQKDNKSSVSLHTRMKSESEMSVVDLTSPDIKVENADLKREEESENDIDFPEDFFDDLANIEFVGGLNVIDTWEPETKDVKNIDQTNENAAADEITKSEPSSARLITQGIAPIKLEIKDEDTKESKAKNINPFNKEIAEAMGINPERKPTNVNRLESRKRNHSRDRNTHNDDIELDYENFAKDFIEVSSYRRRSNSRHRHTSDRNNDRRTSKHSSNHRSKSPVSVTRPRMRFEPPKRKYKPSPPPYEDSSSDRRYRKSRSRRSRSRRSRSQSSYSRSRSRRDGSRRKYPSRRKRSKEVRLNFSPDMINKHTHTRNSLSRFSISPRRSSTNLTKSSSNNTLRKSSILYDNNSSDSMSNNPPVPGLEFVSLNRIPGTNPENPREFSNNSFGQTRVPSTSQLYQSQQYFNSSSFNTANVIGNNMKPGIIHNMNPVVNPAVMNSHMNSLGNNYVMNTSAVMHPMNSVMTIINPVNSTVMNSARMSNSARINNSAHLNNTVMNSARISSSHNNSAHLNNTVMNSAHMNNSAVMNNTQSRVHYKNHESEMYDPADPSTSYTRNQSPSKFSGLVHNSGTQGQRANETRRGIDGDSVKKLFAEKKLSLSEFLTISAKNSVDSTISPKSVEKKVKVLTSCQEAISRLDKLDRTLHELFPSKFIYNETHNADFQRVIVPSSRFVSPLKRNTLIKFKYTTIDPGIKCKTQRIRTMLNTLEIKMDDIKPADSKSEVKSTINNTVKNIVQNKPVVDSVMSSKPKIETCRKMTQTDLYECEICKERNDLRVTDVACQVDLQELASLSIQPLMNFKMSESLVTFSANGTNARNRNLNRRKFDNPPKRGKSRGGRGRARKKAAKQNAESL